MTKQTELMLVEEFSEKELEAISGGATGSLINIEVGDVTILEKVNVALAANVAILGRAVQRGAVVAG